MNRMAGARTRWSGAVTGLAVLAFLPFTNSLGSLPRAILSAIVIAAVASLIRVPAMVRVWRLSPAQGGVAWLTFALTLGLAPHIELAVLFGVSASVAVHIWREMPLRVRLWSEGREVHLEPKGVLWFGSAQYLERALVKGLPEAKDAHRVLIHLGGLGRIDLSGALVLKDILDRAEELGIEVELVDAPAHAHRILWKVLRWQAEGESMEGPTD